MVQNSAFFTGLIAGTKIKTCEIINTHHQLRISEKGIDW